MSGFSQGACLNNTTDVSGIINDQTLCNGNVLTMENKDKTESKFKKRCQVLQPCDLRSRHIFHYKCLTQWALKDNRCPICKTDMLHSVRGTLDCFKDRLIFKRVTRRECPNGQQSGNSAEEAV